MSRLRDLLTDRISANDKSCTLHLYSVATRNFHVSDATSRATLAQQLQGNLHVTVVSHATERATETQQPSCTRAVKNGGNATGVATPEADDFWDTLRARIDECDALIHQLCDARDDDDEHRAALLAVRKRMAPDKLSSDIRYLRAEIQRHLIQQERNKR